jgi:type IV secretory pathway TrbL component
MPDLLKFIYKNKYIDWAVLLLILSFFISLTKLYVTNIVFSLTLGMSFVFFAVAIFQELLFIKNVKVYRYKDAAKLLMLTKKIEKELEILGGQGKGMYEKASSLSQRLSEDTLERILILAEIRNNTVHGNPHIENIHDVFQQAHQILQELKSFYMSKSKYTNNIYTMKIVLLSLFSFILMYKSYTTLGIGAAIFTAFIFFTATEFFFAHQFTQKQIILISIFFLVLNLTLYYHQGYTSLEAYLGDGLHFITALLY